MASGSPPWKDMGFKNPISLFFYIKNNDNSPSLPPLKFSSTNPSDDHVYDQLKNVISRCFQRNPCNRPSASSLLSDVFFVGTSSSVQKSSSETTENEVNPPCNPSCLPSSNGDFHSNSNTSRKPLTQISENEVYTSTLTDSLCYSLSLPAPLFKGDKPKSLDCAKNLTDSSEWPQWAKLSNTAKSSENHSCYEKSGKENSGGVKITNPYSKKSEM